MYLNKYSKIGVLSDIHIPYQDDRALNEALKILLYEKPDCIVINGDLLDFPGLSRYEQVPNFNKVTLKEQIELAVNLLERLRKEHPKADVFFIEGNHEFRFKSYPIKRAPELYDYMDLAVDLDLRGYKVKWVGTQEGAAKWTDTYITLGDLTIGHFDTVANPVIPAGMTVRNIMQKKIKINNVIQSHIHRGAVLWDTNENGDTRFGAECPCLCKNPSYMKNANWVRGMIIVDNIKGKWQPRLIVL